MIRTFHPIGQGAFYTERFDNFTIVYDCGSATKGSHLEDEIKSTFKTDKEIDALFISHFDDDHINGIETLLKNCHVKKVFIPLLTTDEKIERFLFNYLKKKRNKFVHELILDPEEAFKNSDTTLVKVKPVNKSSNNEVFQVLSIDNIEHGVTIESNIKLTASLLANWVFIPFNFQSSTRAKVLKGLLKKEGIQINTIEDFKKYWKNTTIKDQIITTYKRVPGNPNTNSLTLYSGPETLKGNTSISNGKPKTLKCLYTRKETGCIYFGDYDAKGSRKWKQIYTKYQKYWHNIGIVQIPHHGSELSYNRAINKEKSMVSIISAGSNNKYKHPDPKTMKEILLDGGIPLLVSEKPESKILQRVSQIDNK